MGGDRLANYQALLLERALVALDPELFQQGSRPFDVAEEQRYGPARLGGHATTIPPQTRPAKCESRTAGIR